MSDKSGEASMKHDRYTLDYRAAEARQVMSWIKAGQSGCVIGLRGAGKSNFLHFLLRQDVQQHYLGTDKARYTFILVDLLALVEPAEWAVHELLLDRLLTQLQSQGEEDGVQEMASLLREVRHSREPLTAQRAVERGMDIFCQHPEQRLVLLFDEFSSVFRDLSPAAFRGLRAIRDAHKNQVFYIVVATDDLAYLRDNLTEIEHFYRLVSRNVCGLGPYTEADAHQMLRYLAAQRSMEFSERDTAYLIEQSGGHAGLLKSILSQLSDISQRNDLTQIVPLLQEEPVVRAECRKVWVSLSETEQEALNSLIAGDLIDPPTRQRLQRKGLVRESLSEIHLFSPFFADFARRQTPPLTGSIVISRSPRRVQLEGKNIKTLTELEFEMLCYLYQHRGQVCTKDKLIRNVYRQQYDSKTGNISDAMLQQLISRLRAKIEPDRSRPRYIVTVRGEGYKFVEPGES